MLGGGGGEQHCCWEVVVEKRFPGELGCFVSDDLHKETILFFVVVETVKNVQALPFRAPSPSDVLIASRYQGLWHTSIFALLIFFLLNVVEPADWPWHQRDREHR